MRLSFGGLVPLAALIAFAGAAPAQMQDSPLGTNLIWLRDHTGEFPFVDHFKISRTWISGERHGCWDCGPPLDLDPRGWVRSLDSGVPRGGQVARTLLFVDLDGRYPGGTYTVLYDGVGHLEYEGAAVRDEAASRPGRDVLRVEPALGEILIELVETDPADYLRNIRILPPGGVCAADPFAFCTSDAECAAGAGSCRLFAAHPQEQLFHPQFLQNLRPFRLLRFMNWMNADETDVVTWQDYTQWEDAQWRDAPAEVMARLAEVLGVDVWVTIPHAAADGFVRELAVRLQDHVPAERRVYVEYSNEVWNPDFPGHAHAMRRGCALWPDLTEDCDLLDIRPSNGVVCEGHPEVRWIETCDTAHRRWYARRSRQIWDVFTDTFEDDDRVVRVLASQTGNTRLHRQYLDFEGTHAATDVLAVAPYFGIALGSDPAVGDWSLDRLFEELETTSLPDAFDRIDRDVRFLAETRPEIPLVTYEAGQHLLGRGELGHDPDLRALFLAANRDPRMGDLYRRYLAAWKDLGGELLVHYTHVDRPNRFSNFGALEHQNQPHATAPKYLALTEFIDANPCWWAGCEPGGAPGEPGARCVPGATTLCFHDGRFRAEADWNDGRGGGGAGRVRPLTDALGYFWFFTPDNGEVFLKVHDACVEPWNQYWVFASGLTDVGVELTVTDTVTGAVWSMTTEPGETFPPRLDVSTPFTECPPGDRSTDLRLLPGPVPQGRAHVVDGDRFLRRQMAQKS